MMRAAVLGLLLLSAPCRAAEPTQVAVELVLAFDASASVDWSEFDLQLKGVALAFADEEVIAAINNLKPFGAAVAVVQWGGPGDTRLVIPFTHIETGRDAKAFGFLSGKITRWHRASETSIGTAIADCTALLLANAYEGQRVIIDISGDGPDNSGVDLQAARTAARRAGITINGLPIEDEDTALTTYYEDSVIAGSGSFTETARGFDDFARAIREKLLRELRPLAS